VTISTLRNLCLDSDSDSDFDPGKPGLGLESGGQGLGLNLKPTVPGLDLGPARLGKDRTCFIPDKLMSVVLS
jgi:hypothetical protein